MKPAALLLLILFIGTPLIAQGSGEGDRRRNPFSDVKREAGSDLSNDEQEIAGFGLSFYCLRYGYGTADETLNQACSRMSAGEWIDRKSLEYDERNRADRYPCATE